MTDKKEPIPVSMLGRGLPPKGTYSFNGVQGRTPARAVGNWIWGPIFACIGLWAGLGWPFILHGWARIISAAIWYPLVALVIFGVVRAKAAKTDG